MERSQPLKIILIGCRIFEIFDEKNNEFNLNRLYLFQENILLV